MAWPRSTIALIGAGSPPGTSLVCALVVPTVLLRQPSATQQDQEPLGQYEVPAEGAGAWDLTASAALLERAVTLTADRVRHCQRALVAVQAKHRAGMPQVALWPVALPEVAPLDELDKARVDLLRAQVAFPPAAGLTLRRCP
jgi:hypothetical protein